MYAAISIRRTPIILHQIRVCSTTTTPQPHRSNPHFRPHEFANPAPFLGSWEAPSTPREAEAKLDRLRKDYARKMKQVRKEYAYEMEMLRLEKERKDEAAKEARRVENERRKAAKSKAVESKAVERKAFEQVFRQMLVLPGAGFQSDSDPVRARMDGISTVDWNLELRSHNLLRYVSRSVVYSALIRM